MLTETQIRALAENVAYELEQCRVGTKIGNVYLSYSILEEASPWWRRRRIRTRDIDIASLLMNAAVESGLLVKVVSRRFGKDDD